MQSAHDDELKAIGRIHTFEQARQAVLLARERGFTNISLDLMYGLPEQTIVYPGHGMKTKIAWERGTGL